ncbi:MAG: DNA-3-methyladenine glycosylase I [Porticoccaceae bacterium]|nr:DNA-3-methyladenine glycosylase I [Porticoccaceae bacterium]
MTSFQTLYDLAAINKGSPAMLEQVLPLTATSKELSKITDDRYLSMMTRCIFRAGFVWRIIDYKWPGFENAFANFNPLAVAHFSDERLEQLAQDTTIVRHFTKIVAVRNNAVYVLDQQRRHGSFAAFIADWPTEDIVGLWLELKKQGSRLGGNSGPMMLRSMGKDTFLITKDVCDALVHHGFIDKFSVNSQRDLRRVQDIFNSLCEQSGRSLSEVSRILACTV